MNDKSEIIRPELYRVPTEKTRIVLEPIKGGGTSVPLGRFVGERIFKKQLDTTNERRVFPNMGEGSYNIELSGSSTGNFYIRICKNKNNGEESDESNSFNVRAIPQYAIKTTAIEAANTGKILPTIEMLLQSVAQPVDGNGLDVAGERQDLAEYFGWESSSIFKTGPKTPPGVLQSDLEDNFAFVVVEHPDGRKQAFAVRVVTKRVNDSASIGGGTVNVDNHNAREILFLGEEEVDLEDMYDLYETARKNQEFVRDENAKKLASADNTGNDQFFSEKIRNIFKTDITPPENQVRTDEGSPIRAYWEVEKKRLYQNETELNFTEQNRKVLSILKEALGEKMLSWDRIDEIFDLASKPNSSVPEITEQDPTEKSKQAIEHFLTGKFVIRDNGTLLVFDRSNIGVYYKIERGSNYLDFGVYSLNDVFIKRTIEESKKRILEESFRSALEGVTTEITDKTKVGENEKIGLTYKDEQLTIEPVHLNLLINGSRPDSSQSSVLTKLPALIGIDQKCFVCTLINNQPRFFEYSQRNTQTLNDILRRKSLEEAKILQEFLDTNINLVNITKERQHERAEMLRAIEAMQENHEENIDTAKAELKKQLETANLSLSNTQNDLKKLKEAAEEQARIQKISKGVNKRITIFNFRRYLSSRPAETEKVITVPKNGQLIIGRDTSNIPVDTPVQNFLNLNDEELRKISREHVQLTNKQGRTYLKNLSNTNGTFLNGEPVTQEKELHNGDVIELTDVVDAAFQYANGQLRPYQLCSPERMDESTIEGRLIRERVNELKKSQEYKLLEASQSALEALEKRGLNFSRVRNALKALKDFFN